MAARSAASTIANADARSASVQPTLDAGTVGVEDEQFVLVGQVAHRKASLAA